ncbi:protein of unknown function [Streptomyces sp. KY75]|nr:protein of unknown function [Streptomyces sp. KY70]CAD5986997.1 protein of unknown function [Streptomyces sp. KY75]
MAGASRCGDRARSCRDARTRPEPGPEPDPERGERLRAPASGAEVPGDRAVDGDEDGQYDEVGDAEREAQVGAAGAAGAASQGEQRHHDRGGTQQQVERQQADEAEDERGDGETVRLPAGGLARSGVGGLGGRRLGGRLGGHALVGGVVGALAGALLGGVVRAAGAVDEGEGHGASSFGSVRVRQARRVRLLVRVRRGGRGSAGAARVALTCGEDQQPAADHGPGGQGDRDRELRDRPEGDSQHKQRGDEDEHGGTSLYDDEDESRSEYECSLNCQPKPPAPSLTRRTVVY